MAIGFKEAVEYAKKRLARSKNERGPKSEKERENEESASGGRSAQVKRDAQTSDAPLFKKRKKKKKRGVEGG